MRPFTPEEDFSRITDKTEAIRLTRPGSDLEVLIPSALRRKVRREETPDASQREVREAVWIFSDSGFTPASGDRLRDETKVAWTIQAVTHRSAIGCWECKTLDLQTTHRLDTWTDFYSARWSLDVNGVPTATYEITRSGVNVKIVPLKQDKPEAFFVPGAEIFFDAHLNPSPGDYFQTPKGRRYEVREFYPKSGRDGISRCVTILVKE